MATFYLTPTSVIELWFLIFTNTSTFQSGGLDSLLPTTLRMGVNILASFLKLVAEY